MPKLSILICTLDGREDCLNRLLGNLNSQKYFLDDPREVEILINKDKGELTTGAKRNLLLDEAKGDWICYIDDDDNVAFNYIELILKALEGNPDMVGMNLIMTWAGQKAERSFHMLQFMDKEWFDIPDPLQPNHRVYFRGPNHLNPVRREIAIKCRFPEITQAEDRAYAYKIAEFVKTEVNIEQPIYFYLFNPYK